MDDQLTLKNKTNEELHTKLIISLYVINKKKTSIFHKI